MNSVEQAICDGIEKAHEKYLEITGSWLWHAPESFLSTFIGLEILAKTENAVYLDTSLSRILKEREELGKPKAKGPKPAALSLRPDVSVWAKTGFDLRAVIEVKRLITIGQIKSDINKLHNLRNKKFGAKSFFVVAYSVAKTQKTFDSRIKRWNRAGKCSRKKRSWNYDKSEGWGWGYVLL